MCLITTILHCREKNNYARELLEEELVLWLGRDNKGSPTYLQRNGTSKRHTPVYKQRSGKAEIEDHNHRTVKKDMEAKSKCDQIYKKYLRKRSEKYLINFFV